MINNKILKTIVFFALYIGVSIYSISFGQSTQISEKIIHFENSNKAEKYEEATISIKEILDYYQKKGQWDSLIIYSKKLSELGKKSGNLAQEIQGRLDVLNIKKFFGGDRSMDFKENIAIYDLIDTTRLDDDFISGLLQGKAFAYMDQNLLDSATHIANESIRFADKSKDLTQKALSRLVSARILQFNNQYGLAIQNLIEAESIINNEYIDEIIQIRVYRDIGNLCVGIEDFDKAEKYLLKAKSIATAKDYKTFEADSKLFLARLYRHQERYDESLAMANQALKYFQQKGIKTRANDVLSTKAYIYASTHQNESFDKTIDSIQLDSKKLSTNLSILTGFNAMKRNDLNKVKNIIQKINKKDEVAPKYIKSLRKLEYQYYEATGNPSKALSKFKAYRFLEDSINQSNQALKTVRIESEFNRKQQDLKINSLTTLTAAQDKALAVRNTAILLGSIMLCILAALFYGLYRLYRKNQENQKELARQNTLISSALAQNQILIKEIHHRVKNNLQVISSLLSMQERKIKDEGTKEALKSSKSRVQSMSILHQNLYTGENLKDIEVDEYMDKLIQNIIDTYNIDNTIQFTIDVDPIALDIDTLVPLGLISNELICNAIKHAFEDGEDGKIDISLKSDENQITLRITDDGKGFEGNEIPTKKDSIGSRLIKSFTKRLDGTIIIDHTNGSSISIVFDKTKIDG